jgi:predicted acyl esterase
MRARRRASGVASVAVLALPLLTWTAGPRPPAPVHDFEIERDWLTVKDGTRLAVTYFRPVAREDGERFPVLLELLPRDRLVRGERAAA